jgi:HK97 gp10 family phage protein
MEEFNHFPAIIDAFKPAVGQVVRKTALDIQARAASKAAVDTGFLRSSIYTVTTSESTNKGTGERASKARSTRRRVKKANQPSAFPEIAPPPDDQTAYVVVGATYGVYVNYGTRHMAPRPFWEPAIEEARGPFEDAMSLIEDKLREAAG